MALSIKDETTDKLIRQLAEMTGENYTRAIMEAVKERIERLSRNSEAEKRTRLEQVRRVLQDEPPRTYKDGRSLKEIRDELWGI